MSGVRIGSRGKKRKQSPAELIDQANAELAAFLAGHAEERKAELERTLAVERANANHILAEQERRLGEERRALVALQVERAQEELATSLAAAQSRLEQRLASWLEDLRRTQEVRETQLAELGKRQREALEAYDARLEANAEQLASAMEEQRSQLSHLRSELERLAAEISLQAQAEIETHSAERRRALDELRERLKVRERALREQVDREEAEALGRLSVGLADAERRQLEQFSRAIDRAATRYVEEAERRFDTQVKQSREAAANRLSRELDKAMEQFARRAEKDVADRIGEVARSTADRLQRHIDDLARAAEVQQDLSGERLRFVSQRLHEALAGAEERIRAFEEQIEIEVTAKTAELERAIRLGEP